MFNNNRLKTELRLKGWSTRELARRLGCSPSSVSRWVRGLASPSGETVFRLSNLFGIYPTVFYTPSPTPASPEVPHDHT